MKLFCVFNQVESGRNFSLKEMETLSDKPNPLSERLESGRNFSLKEMETLETTN